MNTIRHLFACGLLSIAVACAAGAPDADTPLPTDDAPPPAEPVLGNDGVTRVRNPAEGLWEGTDPPPIRFELDGTFGGAESHVESIAGAAVDGEANVYIYDSRRAELSAFCSEGEVLWRAGSAGTAADQFDRVRGMTYDGEDAIWVVNQDGLRLDAWSLTGEHARSVDLEEVGVGRSFMGGFLASDKIALLADMVYATAANEYVVLRLGDDTGIETRFRIVAQPMTPIPPGIVLQLSHTFHEGKIYLGGWENYTLRQYDERGILQRSVSRSVDYLRRPGFAATGDRYLGVSFGGLAAPIILASGHWLVLASWPTNVDNPNEFVEMPLSQRPQIEWASSVDLFDPDGRFLYSVVTAGAQTPEIGRPWTVGPEGRLYTVSADPVPHVRRYRVALEPPDGQ